MSIFPLDDAFNRSIGRGFMHRLTAHGHMIYTETVEITLLLHEGHGLETVHMGGAHVTPRGEQSAAKRGAMMARTQDEVPLHREAGAEGCSFNGIAGLFGAILIDPPWRFANRTGKVGPEHKRLRRYQTMSFEEIAALPVGKVALPKSHLYLWCPNALLLEALTIMKAWGFAYKTNIVWYKIRKDGGPDGRGVGFYFRNVTELLLFGVKGNVRTLQPGRTQVNLLMSRKREHSRKPVAVYDLIERCSAGPYLELFARERVAAWTQWGDELETYA